MPDVLMRRRKFGHRDRPTGRRPCDDGGKDWSQVTPRITSNHQNPGERHGTHSPLSLKKKLALLTP